MDGSCGRLMGKLKLKEEDDAKEDKSLDILVLLLSIGLVNHIGGRLDVSDLLRFRPSEGASRREDSLKLARLSSEGLLD